MKSSHNHLKSKNITKALALGATLGTMAVGANAAPAAAHEAHKAKTHEHKYTMEQVTWLTELRLNTGMPVTVYNGSVVRKANNKPGGVMADPKQMQAEGSGGTGAEVNSHESESVTYFPRFVSRSNPFKLYDNPELNKSTIVFSQTVDSEGWIHLHGEPYNGKTMRAIPADLFENPVTFSWYDLNKLGRPDIDNPQMSLDGRTTHGGPFDMPKTGQPMTQIGQEVEVDGGHFG
jgi:hypothetical protein